MQFLSSLLICSQLKIFFVIMMAFSVTNGEEVYKIDCKYNRKCSVLSEEGNACEVKNMACVDYKCNQILALTENHLLLCLLPDKKSGECEKLLKKNEQSIIKLIRLKQLIDNEPFDGSSSDQALNSAETNLDTEYFDKRALPFETLNYGRRKRQLPFETLNYGKRNQNCDCSGSGSMIYKRALPFDAPLFGKRALPFDALNYGKRAYIPNDGYIMGKREE